MPALWEYRPAPGWINLANLEAAPPATRWPGLRKHRARHFFTPMGHQYAACGARFGPTRPPSSLPQEQLVVSNAISSRLQRVGQQQHSEQAGAIPTNLLTGSIAPKTGLLTLTFGNGSGKAATPDCSPSCRAGPTAEASFWARPTPVSSRCCRRREPSDGLAKPCSPCGMHYTLSSSLRCEMRLPPGSWAGGFPTFIRPIPSFVGLTSGGFSLPLPAPFSIPIPARHCRFSHWCRDAALRRPVGAARRPCQSICTRH